MLDLAMLVVGGLLMAGIMAYAYVAIRAQAFLYWAASAMFALGLLVAHSYIADPWLREVVGQIMTGMAVLSLGWGLARLLTVEWWARARFSREVFPTERFVKLHRVTTQPPSALTIELSALAFVLVGLLIVAVWHSAMLLGLMFLATGVELGVASLIYLRRRRG